MYIVEDFDDVLYGCRLLVGCSEWKLGYSGHFSSRRS